MATTDPSKAPSDGGAALPRDDSAADLPHVRDPCKPGLHDSRKREIRAAEQAGGAPVLWNAWLNRDTNFSEEERERLGLEGLLPAAHEDLELQAARVMETLGEAHLHPLDKYTLLREVHSTNQMLFYKVLLDNIVELAPVVYTPTVGLACQRFHRIYRRPGGVYLSAFAHRGRFAQVLRNWPSHNVQIIVCSDGGRILGLGDLGANGMGIPLGKIALFCAAGGFHPEHAVPLLLDAGTNNEELLADRFYMGERRRRLEGEDYFSAVAELCAAVKAVWPQALLQWEDFGTAHAFEILERHRGEVLSFNDDIQGTGAVVAAGVINGLKVQGTPASEARLLFFGAGSSAVGVAGAIAAYLEHETGASADAARRAIYMVDSKGLVTTGRGDELPAHKLRFARRPEEDGLPAKLQELKDVVAFVKPHALVGLSAAGPSWDKGVIQELCAHVASPLVFPLSNPTDRAEITAEQAVEWSGGKCLFASGSPFDPVDCGGDKKVVPGQANNVFIFPGVGFGAVMAKASRVTDEMFTAAAKALAGCVVEEEICRGQLYPEMARLREVSATVAAAVARSAWGCGVSGLEAEPEDWGRHCESLAWWPKDPTADAA